MVVYYESSALKAKLDTLRLLENKIENLEREGSMGAHNLSCAQGLIDEAAIFLKSFKN
jgi:hypothetical protein